MASKAKATISVRKYIKWADAPPSEPTSLSAHSTLVLTSPLKHFVDTRLLMPTDGTHTIDTIDWAFAGTSSTTPATASQPEHTVWTHWVDSTTPDGENVKDEGDMFVLESGEVVERGEMVNPATGKLEKYEESWRDIKPLGDNVGWVLKVQVQGQEQKGVVVRIGGFAQGVLRRGGEVGVKRWRFMGEERGWDPILAIGPLEIPTEVFGEKANTLVEGDRFVGEGGLDWVCVERFEGDW